MEIIAGVTRGKRPTSLFKWPIHLYWLFGQWLTGKGKFIHCYVGFKDNGRDLIYHLTKNRGHIMLSSSFFAERELVAAWRMPVDHLAHRRLADSCFADSGVRQYGNLQNLITGIIKLWNRIVVERFRLKFLEIKRNWFGSGERKQNCSEGAGLKLKLVFPDRFVVNKDPDCYTPGDYYDECEAFELSCSEVKRVA